ncbi:MAG: FAD-dependent oxidoreductase [Desulfovibrionaceae bacterium]|nr:FAD-dependent oxidoreductase [Desulfovibrionaceae bacterium]
MKIIIVGAVAAGTSAGAKASRNDRQAAIVIYEKDTDISYAGCGLAYYIGGKVDALEQLAPRDPAYFKKKYNIDIFTEHEVLAINAEAKNVLVKNLRSGEVFTDPYDKLVLATGASPFIPKIEGITDNRVFFLRNMNDARMIKTFIETHHPKTALVAGTGPLGLEILENLTARKMDVTIVELANQITQNLDRDMAADLENILVNKGVKLIKSAGVTNITPAAAVLSNGQEVHADLIIMATGVRPNVSLAQKAGVATGVTGAIRTNLKLQTNIADIYACGDCVETYSAITGKPVFRPLGSTANKLGRIAGHNVTGGTLEYKGNLSTSIVKFFDFTIASTGLSEKEALAEGFAVATCRIVTPDKPAYMHGEDLIIKGIADKATGRFLGAQIIGKSGVDKRIDVFATLITYKANADELFHLDLAYAPQYSTPKDAVHYTGMVLDSVLHHGGD